MIPQANQDHLEDEADLLEQLTDMQRTLAEIKEVFIQETKSIEELMSSLNAENSDVIQEIMETLAALEEDLNEYDFEDESEFSKAMEDGEEEAEEREEGGTDEAEANMRRMVSKLFKEIALKTHPDRTRNPKLRSIYMQAQDAYGKQDLERLYELHSKVFNRPYKKIPIEKRIAELILQLDAAYYVLTEHRKSDEYRLLRMAETYGEEYAKHAHRELLKEILKQRKRDLAHAKEF